MNIQPTTARITPAAVVFAVSSLLSVTVVEDAQASHRHHGINQSRAVIGGPGYGPGIGPGIGLGYGPRHGRGYGRSYGSHYLPAVVIGGGYPHHHREAYQAHHAAPQPGASTSASSKIFAYPANGQNKEQQARDKFECYGWAVDESGFDPVAHSSHSSAAATPVSHTVRPNNPGPSDPVTGAAGGAALGAIGGAIAGDPGLGAAIGAAVGGSVGLANHVDEKSREKTITSSPSRPTTGGNNDYRRAMTACLEARGYTVK